MEGQFDFMFSLDEKVVTPFGDEGLVSMLGYDDGGRKYYVQTATNSDWFKELQLNSGEIGNDVSDFLEAMAGELDGECKTPMVEAYNAYKEFCEINGFRPRDIKFFIAEMAANGLQRCKVGGRYSYLGLRLLQD